MIMSTSMSRPARSKPIELDVDFGGVFCVGVPGGLFDRPCGKERVKSVFCGRFQDSPRQESWPNFVDLQDPAALEEKCPNCRTNRST